MSVTSLWSATLSVALTACVGPPRMEQVASTTIDPKEVDAAAIVVIASADGHRDESFAAAVETLGGARQWLSEAACTPEFRIVQSRAATAVCERYYFDRDAESGELARAALARLRTTGDPVTDAWTALALRSARDAGLTTDRVLERQLLSRSDAHSLDATCRVLAAHLVVRAVLLPELEADGASARLRDVLLRRSDEALSDPEAAWFASIGFFQWGGSQWDQWNRQMKRVVVDRHGFTRGDDTSRASESDAALWALSTKIYFRYSANVGSR